MILVGSYASSGWYYSFLLSEVTLKPLDNQVFIVISFRCLNVVGLLYLDVRCSFLQELNSVQSTEPRFRLALLIRCTVLQFSIEEELVK